MGTADAEKEALFMALKRAREGRAPSDSKEMEAKEMAKAKKNRDKFEEKHFVAVQLARARDGFGKGNAKDTMPMPLPPRPTRECPRSTWYHFTSVGAPNGVIYMVLWLPTSI